MNVFLTYTALGLVLGAVYGIAASGLVLTYNTSGIFNFAHGAEAMLGAFFYWQLRFGWNLPAPIALLLTIGVFAPLMGGLLYLLIIRGLRNTAEVTKVVVTVSILLGAVALSQWVWNPIEPRTLQKFFGYASNVKFLGITLTTHDLITLGAAVAIALGLRMLFYRTRVGVSMRAVVDDPDLVQLNGHNPNTLALLSWVLGGVLAVLAGVLVTPIGGGSLDANILTLLVIQSFAAAMFGKLRSIPRTFVGAIVLGLAGTYVLAYFPSSWSWTSNFRISLPMIILFVVLIVLPQDRLTAGAVRTRERARVPSVRQAVIAGAALVVSVVLLRLLMVDSAVSLLTLGLTYSVMALSLVLLTGYAGQMNLAVLSFGAIATIIVFHNGITGRGVDARLTLWGIVIAVAITAVVGALIALPALRMRGLYLALATMAFGVFVSDMLLNDITPHVLPLLHTQFSIFPDGSLIIPRLKVGPLDLADDTTFLMSATVLFALLGIGMVALRNSGYGRRLTALKDSPVAAAMLGQRLVRLKLSVFALSAGIAGLGGILMSSALGSVTADNFTIFISLSLVMLTVAAGIGYVTGALAGGVLSGVGFVVIISSFNNLAHGSEGLHGLYSTLAHIAAVLPALIGITIGRSPSGFLHELCDSWRRMWNGARHIVYGGLAVEAALYVLALTGLLDNWWFGIGTYLIITMLPVVGMIAAPAVMTDAPVVRPPQPESIGIEVPYTEKAMARVDARLGLTEREATATAGPPTPPARVAATQGVRS